MSNNHRIGVVRRDWIAVITAILIMQPTWKVHAQQPQPAPAAAPAKPADSPPATKLPNDQLDSLVAPIALYPDALLAQVLVASTYPLEIVQLQQWLEKNSALKDKALADAVKKENWDPSIQSMAPMPEVVKRLAGDIKWTTDLGNAFLAQQSDVMDAVQRMRKKAQDQGNLKSSKEQKVETKTVEQQTETTKVVEKKEVIVIEQSNPQVVYVPSYNPVVVYGPPVYPYPPIYYPPPGYYAAGVAISFGVGMAMGAAWGGGWCCGASWGGNDIDINVDNDFNRNSNRNVNRNTDRNTARNTDRSGAGNRAGNQAGGGNKWSHNPQHRGAAPYSDRATSDRFGGGTQNARANASNRPSVANTSQGLSNRAQGGNANAARQSQGAASRSAAGAGAAGGARPGGSGGDRVGNRSVPNSGSANRGAFGGAGSGGGSAARAASSRGSGSMSRGGGGGGRRR